MDKQSDVGTPVLSSPRKNAQSGELLRVLGRLVHELQMERGCTALYVDSKGALFGEELERQYAKTDASVAAAQAAQKRLAAKGASERTRQTTGDLVDNLELLPGHRAQVTKQLLPFSDAVNIYTYKYTSPITDTLVETALFTPGADSAKVSAYSNFVQWKERVGRERAWGMHGFCGKSFGDRQFVERFLELIHEQRSYRAAFFSLANGAQRAIVASALGDTSVARVHSIHDALEDVGDKAMLNGISAVEWFDLITAKIDRMYNAEIQLTDNLAVRDDEDQSKSSLVKRRANGAGDTLFSPYLALLRTVPVFASLSPDELDELLSHAEIRTEEKGKLLVLQGEPASRYYVVLNGWVKLYKGDESGAEAILQMLTSGDTLQDTAVFLDAPAPASAQIVEDAVLLSVPASILRQAIRENAEMAVGMLDNLSHRSEDLIEQIGQNRLRSASERVGWFLLKLQLEAGGLGVSHIVLPYDKSLLASYLDMTPETFSRTLKRFRQQGLVVTNNTITLPRPNSLCAYCDEKLSAHCQHRGQADCPNVDYG